MKTCTKCGEEKPPELFPSAGARCKRCVADYAIVWRNRHIDRINKESRERYEKRYRNDPEVQEGYRRRRMKRLFGITPTQFDAMLEAQHHVCAICGREERGSRGHNGNKQKRRLAIDHCHVTGKVRGLLCSRCNLMLGWIEDQVLFGKVMAYLNFHTKVHTVPA